MCFTLGITQPMSSDYNGEYTLAVNSNPFVTVLALNISASRPDIESVATTITNLKPTPIFTTAESQETIYSARYISTHSNPFLTGDYHEKQYRSELTDLLHINLTDSHDEIAVNPIIVLFTLAFACTTIICVIFVGHKIYKCKKRQPLSSAGKFAGRSKDNDAAIETADSWH